MSVYNIVWSSEGDDTSYKRYKFEDLRETERDSVYYIIL